MDTIGVNHPRIVKLNHLNNDPDTWSEEDVVDFLRTNKKQFRINDEDMKVMEKTRISGYTFIKLTKETLATFCGVSIGGAFAIETLIQQLIAIRKEVQQKEQVPEPSTLPLVHPSSLPTYAKKSSMSDPGTQTRNDITPLLEAELDGTIYKDVQGFDKLFLNVMPQIDPEIAAPTFDNWLMSAKSTDNKAFERCAVEWFTEFCRKIDLRGNTTGRSYYGSGDTHLKDAIHGAQRKLDICLSIKLEDSHTKAKAQHSWKDVLVLGEFKSNRKTDLGKDTILQLARYVREAFGAQPGRRFVHAFTVCGARARFWMFDRVGVSVSEVCDISTAAGQSIFMHRILCYMNMNASQLGFDKRYTDQSGKVFLPFPGGPSLHLGREENPPSIDQNIYLSLGDKKFQLIKILSWSAAIVTRGTLCWLAKENDSGGTCTNNNCIKCTECRRKLCVVKEAWRDNNLSAESDLWQLAQQNGVRGALDVVFACNAEVASRDGEEENNVRRWFDYTQAVLIQWKDKTDSNDKADSEQFVEIEQPLSTKKSSRNRGVRIEPMTKIHSEDNEVARSEANMSSRKRPGGQLDPSRPPKTRRFKDSKVVQARTRTFMVVRNVGDALDRSVSPLELVQILRDAIEIHRSLYEKARILHCDISISNILRTRRNDNDYSTSITKTQMDDTDFGLKGFLIDLDYAQQLDSNPEQSLCRTGTPPFMAVQILSRRTPVHHTWRHDLESFFYVLIWCCIKKPLKTLERWVKCLDDEAHVTQKWADVTLHLESVVLSHFRTEFNVTPLRELTSQFRDILFYGSADYSRLPQMHKKENDLGTAGTPVGEAARCSIYDDIIRVFDHCITNLQQVRGQGIVGL